jgi:L-iditol 2-dehydrogenase
MKFRAAAMEGIGRVRLVEREVEPAADQIVVKTHASSICLADLQIFRQGYYYPDIRPQFPMYPGHEGGGIVAAVGSRIHEWKEGDRVALMHDPRPPLYTFPGGGMADYFVAGPYDVIPVPDGLHMDLACLAETFNPFISVVFRSGVKLGDTVCVTGANFIGQIVAQGMKKSGALQVTVVDNRESRLSLARRLGADHIINSTSGDAYQEAMAITGGRGFDIVAQTAAYIDSTVEEYMNLATELVRPMGILIFQGDFLHPVNLTDIHRWHHQSLDIRSLGWRHYTHQLIEMWSPDCLRILQHGLVDVRSLITATYPLEQIEEAFKMANEDPDQLKVVIKP